MYSTVLGIVIDSILHFSNVSTAITLVSGGMFMFVTCLFADDIISKGLFLLP